MDKDKYTNLSILMKCQSPTDILKKLNIDDNNITSYTNSTPQFLEKKLSGAMLENVKGEFSHIADVFLFGMNIDEVYKLLMEESNKEVSFAIPNEKSGDLENYDYFSMGNLKQVRIFEKDGFFHLTQ